VCVLKMALVEILGIFIAIGVGIVTYFKWIYKYWEKRNVPFLEPTIPFGNLENPFTRKYTPGVYVKNIYHQLKSQGHKHAGFYLVAVPNYIPLEPELIKNILQKDFQYFTERGFYYNEKDDPLSAHLFAIGGAKWRKLRTKLTPTFTSGKMKMMFNTLVQSGDQMLGAMNELHQNKQGIDIKEVLACYTTDVIGSCAFGLDCNSFKTPDAEFRKYGKQIFAPSLMQNLRIVFGLAQPSLARFLGIKILDPPVSNFFMNIVKDTVKYREANDVDRKDMMKLLIDIKNNRSGEGQTGDGLTMEELAAQAFVFFFAGFETSSTTMTFCLYELAKNQEIQQKVRDEVNHVLSKHNGEITYDSIMDMKYMNQVIDETLRKYPPVPFITRESVQDYNVPNMDLTLSKGTHVIIPIMGLHYDAEYFPNPETFDPERFSEENRHQIPPFTFMPFGEGPRICIGLRFGLMQTKVGLSILLKNYKFSINKKTVQPIFMDPYSFILTSKTGIFLDAEKL